VCLAGGLERHRVQLGRADLVVGPGLPLETITTRLPAAWAARA
jgi:hypothetical protein